MIDKLVDLPLKHVAAKFLIVSISASLAETLSELAYHKAFKLPIKK